MKSEDPPGDDRWRDQMVGNAQVPLPEPWFIRDLRRPAVDGTPDVPPQAEAKRAPVDDLVLERDHAVLPETEPVIVDAGERRPLWQYIAAAGFAAVVLLALWLAATPRSGGAADIPAATTPVVPSPAVPLAASAAPGLCASPATLDELRSLVVGEAARGGGEPQDIEAAAAGLSLSVTETSDNSGETGAVQCNGWLTLVRSGEAPVTARIGFRALVDRGAAHVSILQGIGPIAAVLAGTEAAIATPAQNDIPVQRSSPPVAADVPVTVGIPSPARAEAPVALPPPAPVAAQPEFVEQPRYSNPSFDCRRATSQANRMICNNDSLAALDRSMSALFQDVMDDADRDTRADLEDGRRDFLIRKQRCDDEACIAEAYRDRIEELRTYR